MNNYCTCSTRVNNGNKFPSITLTKYIKTKAANKLILSCGYDRIGKDPLNDQKSSYETPEFFYVKESLSTNMMPPMYLEIHLLTHYTFSLWFVRNSSQQKVQLRSWMALNVTNCSWSVTYYLGQCIQLWYLFR